jgi:hypothetical protein
MKFFKTSEDRLHTGRIAGVIYVLALLPGCRYFLDVGPVCVMRIVFTAGWWLSFCDKQPARTISEMARPIRMIGIIALLLGIVGQFYFAGRP